MAWQRQLDMFEGTRNIKLKYKPVYTDFRASRRRFRFRHQSTGQITVNNSVFCFVSFTAFTHEFLF